MIKTKYVYEQQLGQNLFIMNLLTFRYLLLDRKTTTNWINNNIVALQQKNELIEQHFLVEDDTILLKVAFDKLSSKGNLCPSNVIFITDECNQKCTYCFERENKFLNKTRTTLSEKDIDKIFDMICHFKHNKKKYNGSITIFGGEPLLLKNRHIIEYCLKRLKSLRLSKATIVTNGITLHHYLDLLNQFSEQIYALVITLNGYGPLHDIIRGSEENPTFNIIIDNIKKCFELKNEINIKINILLEKRNINKINELLDFLQREKLLQDKRIHIAFGRIQSRTNPQQSNYSFALPYEKYYSSIFQNYYHDSLITDEMIEGSEVSVMSNIYKSWKHQSVAYPLLRGCEAVYPGRFCYYVDGYIYPCTEIAGNINYAIGNYREMKMYSDSLSQWSEYNLRKLKCADCKYIGMCCGACPITNTEVNGSMSEVYCLNMETSLKNMIDVLYKKGFFNGNNLL